MPGTTDPVTTASRKDWTRQPLSVMVWWGLPLAFGMSASLLELPLRANAGVWAGALAWMALGCLLNAARCHRLHCYISGPILLVGAIGVGLVAAGVVDPGPRMLSIAVNTVLVLAVLSFVPELVWKRYA
jgi:hypothetical protein